MTIAEASAPIPASNPQSLLKGALLRTQLDAQTTLETMASQALQSASRFRSDGKLSNKADPVTIVIIVAIVVLLALAATVVAAAVLLCAQNNGVLDTTVDLGNGKLKVICKKL